MATNKKRKKKAEVMAEDGSMTLTGHRKELRNRLIICAVVFVAVSYTHLDVYKRQASGSSSLTTAVLSGC